jgi:hypothetical protein
MLPDFPCSDPAIDDRLTLNLWHGRTGQVSVPYVPFSCNQTNIFAGSLGNGLWPILRECENLLFSRVSLLKS